MTGFDENQVWNGTWGQVWVDGELLSEATKFRAEVNIEYEDVNMARNLMSGKKITGIKGDGEITLYKISSYILDKVSENIKDGIVPDIAIESSIQDPGGIGEERVVVKHVKFDKITLADWERKKIEEESYSFSFSDFDKKQLATY